MLVASEALVRVLELKMTFFRIGFKMIILEPVKEFVRENFNSGINYCLGVTCTRVWDGVISVTSNVAFFTFIKEIN